MKDKQIPGARTSRQQKVLEKAWIDKKFNGRHLNAIQMLVNARIRLLQYDQAISTLENYIEIYKGNGKVVSDRLSFLYELYIKICCRSIESQHPVTANLINEINLYLEKGLKSTNSISADSGILSLLNMVNYFKVLNDLDQNLLYSIDTAKTANVKLKVLSTGELQMPGSNDEFKNMSNSFFAKAMFYSKRFRDKKEISDLKNALTNFENIQILDEGFNANDITIRDRLMFGNLNRKVSDEVLEELIDVIPKEKNYIDRIFKILENERSGILLSGQNKRYNRRSLKLPEDV